MKNIIVSTFCAVALAVSANGGEELIANGDFSQLDGAGWAVGWPRGNHASIEKDAGGNRLVLTGAGSGVNLKVPIRPNIRQLKLSMKMKVTDVNLGKESWQTGRLAMSFHNAAGERVGAWPDVFGMVGTTGWELCERIYPVPADAVSLSFSPSNLGASGNVEFKAISLTVHSERVLVRADAVLPAGAGKIFLGLDDAWRQVTTTREKICLNGLWGFRPVTSGDAVQSVPATGDCWGWFKVPGIWPNGSWELTDGIQQVWFAPWLEERFDTKAMFDQAWYKRRIAVPAAWAERRIVLDFTMLQSHVQAFVDGVACGELWYPGGELDLTGKLKPGAEQELALLVTARPLTSERNAFMAPDRVITDKASVKLRGITGDLFLLATPAKGQLKDIQIVTSVRNHTVTFVVETAGLGAGKFRLGAEVKGRDGQTRKFESAALTPDSSGGLRFTAGWRDAKLWDTDSPQNLYEAMLTLKDEAGKSLDVLTPVTFGFREVWLDGRNIVLNGTTVHLRALHNTTANGGADKASRVAAREMCRRMFEYGFNAIIGGNYDFTPGSVGYLDALLDACDEMGMLMTFTLPHMKDFGNRLEDPAMAERYRQQAAWLIRRARNHPSVIFYALNHNSTGYYGDQNPLKIDGIYEIPETEASRNKWWARNRKQARITDAIAKELDPTRPVYHHQSGNLGDMHTVNCYLNWAPVQERSDWLEHWAGKGVKPLFFVEWGLPHISSWSSYRGPQFIWRCEAFQSLWASEFAAQFWGDAAYRDDAAAVKALDHEESLWARGKPFSWSQLNQPLRDLSQSYSEVQAFFADDNWRSHRAWGVSAMLPWDQGDFWQRIAPTNPSENKDAFSNIKCPGIVPDRFRADNQYINDTGDAKAFVPTAVGKSFLRWNMPDCAFIGGAPDALTSKDHLVAPGATLKKSLVVINDRRRSQKVKWSWCLRQADKKIDEDSGSVKVVASGKFLVPVSLKVPAKAADGTVYRLSAQFEFEGGVKQADDFELQTVVPPQKLLLKSSLLLVDSRGLTTALFDRLGIAYKRFEGNRAPGEGEVVVIGRESLDEKGLPWLGKVSDGVRVLVFEQRASVLEGLLGFRIAERGSRVLFPRFEHPVTRGMDKTCFRDWSGSATLLPRHLEDLPEAEMHDPIWKWCGFQNTHVWRCGGRGNVASVLIEKPSRGDWRALVDGEFDLQYSPLLETVTGRGRVIFCQLDVTGRTVNDPVADRLVVSMLEYLDTVVPGKRRVTMCAGDGRGSELLQQLGVVTRPLSESVMPGSGTLLVAGPGAVPPAGLAQTIEKGLNVVCLGLSGDELKAWSPVTIKTERVSSCFKRIENAPKEFNGLSNADWYWHGRLEYEALKIPDGKEKESSPSLRVVRHGSGTVVICQVPPWLIDEKAKPYLRTSKRRANYMVARILANLGADFRTPLGERFSVPVEKAWLSSYYLDVPVAEDDPYRYYRW